MSSLAGVATTAMRWLVSRSMLLSWPRSLPSQNDRATPEAPANEDMPAAPPLRPKAERDARDEGERREHRGNGHGPKRGNGNGPKPGNGNGRGGHRPFGERSRADRPSAPAEHQWSRGDYRDAPQGERTHDDRPRTGPVSYTHLTLPTIYSV